MSPLDPQRLVAGSFMEGLSFMTLDASRVQFRVASTRGGYVLTQEGPATENKAPKAEARTSNVQPSFEKYVDDA